MYSGRQTALSFTEFLFLVLPVTWCVTLGYSLFRVFFFFLSTFLVIIWITIILTLWSSKHVPWHVVSSPLKCMGLLTENIYTYSSIIYKIMYIHFTKEFCVCMKTHQNNWKLVICPYLLQLHTIPFFGHFHCQLTFCSLSRDVHLMGHTVPYHSAAPSLGLPY